MKVAALIATISFAALPAPTALAFDPIGIIERSLRNALPSEMDRAVRSLASAVVMQLPSDTSSPEASNGDAILYTRTGCGYCVQAVRHLQATGASYVEKNVQTNPIANSEFRRIGARGVPVLVAGDEVVEGFSAPLYDRAIARMAQALADAEPSASSHESTRAYKVGDRLSPSRGPLALLGIPNPEGVSLGTVARGTALTYIGPARNGFLYVSAGQLEGWADARSLSPLP
ncbi:MAG: glutaredoxin domain-containing protein [Thauera propionica]|jgi:glutaredoxin|nr:glutaredoxin domain-containing protein [Thauera propionica]